MCALNFIFQPTIPGPITEDAWIADNSLNTTWAQQVVPMTGNAVANTAVATTTTVVVNPATAIYGTPVLLTANVTSGPGSVINGNVEFSINGVEIAGAALTGSGTATITVPAAPTGSDIVTATFVAQGNDLASSGTANLIVTPANSQISLSASAIQTRLGQNVIFTANVSSTTTGMPTGTVVFLNGSAQIGEALLNATGQAILNTQNLPPGTDTITAQYQGDVNFQQSISASVTVTVADDILTMTASPTLLTISTGQTGQTTVTLALKNGFAGTVSLSCAGLIHGATCQFSSPTVVFVAQTQTPQTVTLVINPNTVAIAGFWLPAKASPMLRLLLLLLGLGAILLPFFSRRRSATLGWGARSAGNPLPRSGFALGVRKSHRCHTCLRRYYRASLHAIQRRTYHRAVAGLHGAIAASELRFLDTGAFASQGTPCVSERFPTPAARMQIPDFDRRVAYNDRNDLDSAEVQ